MTERTYEVMPVGIEYVCDDCNTGVMEQTGIFLPVDPPLWTHMCNRCGARKNFCQAYPTIRFKQVQS